MKNSLKSFTKISIVSCICVLMFSVINSSLVLGAESIIDDTQASFSGNWYSSTITPGYYGDGYMYIGAGFGSNTATWNLNVPQAGSWQVFARWTSAYNRATNAPYTINHLEGTDTQRVNQRMNGGLWISLGTYSFAQGQGNVTLFNDADGYVIADAIRIVEVSAPPTQPIEIILDEPIEVEGTVKIDDSNPIAVTIGNPIRVINAEGFTPIYAEDELTINEDFMSAGHEEFYKVPENKTLVIEYVSVLGRVYDPEDSIDATIYIYRDAQLQRHYLGVLQPTGRAHTIPGGYVKQILSQTVKIYVASGLRVGNGFARIKDDESVDIEMTISGYLFDAPS